MSINQPTSTAPNYTLLDANPTLYAAVNAGNPQGEDKLFLDNLMALIATDHTLNSNHNLATAKENFLKFDPNIQSALKFINPTADYQQPSPSIMQKAKNAMVATLKSPLQVLEAAGGAWTQATHFSYGLTAGWLGAKSDSDAFHYITSRKTYSDLWSGHNQWSPFQNERLTAQHGEAMSILAKGLIDGKTPGQIIREYGRAPDVELANAIKAYSDYTMRNDPNFKGQLTPGAKAFKAVYDDFTENQTSPGRDITGWANRNHPPKDGGVWGAALSMLFTLPTLGGQEVAGTPGGKKWLTTNLNPFSKTDMVSPSGSLDAVYSVAVDPITWLTGGTSKAMSLSEKLAEQFTKTANNKGVEIAVSDLFKVPAFANRQAGFPPLLNALRDARAAKDHLAANSVMDTMRRQFPEYADNEPLLNRMLTAKPFNTAEKISHIVDMPTLESFFQMGQDANYLISGKLTGTQYYRENHVMLERKTRKLTDGMRQFFQEVYHGPEAIAAAGLNPIPDSALKSWSEWDKFFANAPERVGVVNPITDDVLKNLGIEKKRFSTSVKTLMARHPSQAMIFTEDGLVHKSANAFRDWARLLVGDKLPANLITERFLSVDVEERWNMLASMESLYHDKIGLNSTADGMNASKSIIENRYAPRGMGPIYDPAVPEHMASPNLYHSAEGASQAMHTTEGVELPNFDQLHKLVYDNTGMYHGLSRYLSLGGMTNNAFARIVNKIWAAFQLIPKLGIRSAVDELTMGLMVQSPRAIFNYFSGKGRRLSNVVTAVTGDEKSMGILKARILSLGGKLSDTGFGRAIKMDVRNPAEFISAKERVAMGQPVQLEADFDLPNGKTIPATEYVDADEYYGATVHERVVARCIAKYAGKLTAEEHGYLTDFLMHNPLAMEGMVRSKIANAFADTFVEGGITKEMFGASKLTEAVDEAGLKALGKFTEEHGQLIAANRTMVHYSEFFKMLSKNTFSTPWGKTLDFGELFFKYNGVGTRLETEAYINEAMHTLGWSKERGQWVTKSFEPYKGKQVTSMQADHAVKAFNGRFVLQAKALRRAGLSEAEVSESILRNALKELYTVVHGDSDAFNKELILFIQRKADAAADKIATREEKTASWNAFRRSAGAGLKEPSEATRLKWEKIQARQTSYAGSVEKTAYSEFEELTKAHPLKGNLKTNYNFDELIGNGRDVKGLYAKYKNMPWEAMDRQLTDIYRSDAFHLKVLEQRKIMASNEDAYVKELVKELKRNKKPGEALTQQEIESAQLQGRIYFSNKATDNAMNEIMKYADNPDVRTQMAWNLRVVGRFYRATEDYARRFVRMLSAHPDKVIYRIGHTSQAMSGSGVVYTDQNTGMQYVILPHDGPLISAIAPVLAILSNPLASAGAVASGNWSFFKQPDFNQYTLKLSMLNPSYSDSSGVPSFSGPSIAIPVETLKHLLGGIGRKTDNAAIVSFAENLDNWILGPGSDNTTWIRSIVPSSILNAWAAFDPEHKTAAAATAFMQAAAYLQFNKDTRMTTADWQNDAKKQQYYDRLRLMSINLIVVKSGFNTISPLPLGTTDVGIPSELRKAGIISFSQEFNDILRAVMDSNAKYGYQLEDPIGTAVSLFAGSYPDKLIFTVSKNSNAAKLAINYTNETKNWIIGHQKLIDSYPEVAYIFAPHVGKYNPAVQKIMEAADLISASSNPFTMNGGGLTNYMEQLSAVVLRAQFYDIDRNLNARLTDPNNPERNRETYRAEQIALATAEKANLKANNFNLKDVLDTAAVNPKGTYAGRFTSLANMANDPRYADVIPEGQMHMLQTMTNLTKQMAVVLSDPNIRQQNEGLAAVQKVKREGLANLEKISKGNIVLINAYSGFIKPYIDNLFQDTTVAMGK